MEKKIRIDNGKLAFVDEVYIVADNIVTNLGFTSEENFDQVLSGYTGIKLLEDEQMAPEPFYASVIGREALYNRFSLIGNPDRYTRFEQLVLCSVHDALQGTNLNVADKRVLFVLSTTKGNVEQLGESGSLSSENKRPYLWQSGEIIKSFLRLHNDTLVVSNACVSGLVAILTGARLIRAGLFDHAIVTGADVLSEFIYSGFSSFKSLSQGPCRPFDKSRDGLSLGEGAGTVILSSRPDLNPKGEPIHVGRGFSSNDANHISGPSRNGEGLYIAIQHALRHFRGKVDHISAHGTATPYNDEMEAIAISRSGLQDVPVNSLKGCWGHTLGAAGIIESVAALHSIRKGMLPGTKGFQESGVSHPVHVIAETRTEKISNCLKIASGFGGCNAAIMFYR
ncbi:MAG: beta-ketoacyl synthase [Bacteroidales bacterium]|nr:beta-ketoacyl synthase [Bacteroidales bacterium]